MASADVATAKAKATLINNLIVVSSYKQPDTRCMPRREGTGAEPNQRLECETGELATVIIPRTIGLRCWWLRLQSHPHWAVDTAWDAGELRDGGAGVRLKK